MKNLLVDAAERRIAEETPHVHHSAGDGQAGRTLHALRKRGLVDEYDNLTPEGVLVSDGPLVERRLWRVQQDREMEERKIERDARESAQDRIGTIMRKHGFTLRRTLPGSKVIEIRTGGSKEMNAFADWIEKLTDDSTG